MLKTVPEIDLSRCNGCGICVERCPVGAATLTGEGAVSVSAEDCTYCTECEALCPSGAISCPFEIVVEQ